MTKLFLPHEVLLIQSIPLCQRPVEDKLIWSHNSSGVYSVKSGYKLLSQGVVVSDHRAQGVDKDVWKVVWGLQVQNKIRNFFWRAIRNSIPLKTNLVQRKVLVDDTCDHCHHEPEDVLHALWLCPLLDPIWSSNPCWDFRASIQFSSYVELAQYLIKECLNIGLFAQTSWTIWFRRNQLRTSTKPFPVEQVVPDALAALSAFILAAPPKIPAHVIWPPHHIKWKPPDPHCLKVNFDGAVFRDENTAGVGVIIRNEKGALNKLLHQFNMVKEKSATTAMEGNELDQSNQPPHHAIWKPPPWPILKVNSDVAIFLEQNSVGVVLEMGGGLALLWRLTIDVIVEGSGTTCIDTMFQEEDRQWRLCCVALPASSPLQTPPSDPLHRKSHAPGKIATLSYKVERFVSSLRSTFNGSSEMCQMLPNLHCQLPL
nr:hypothetical protein CFP56_45438 [Quercus suber]